MVILSLMLVIGILAACSGKSNNGGASSGTSESSGSTSESGTSESGSDNSEQVFRMNLTAEPPTLDPAQMQDQVSSTVMTGLFEGLTKMDETGKAVPAMAESWGVSEDGKSYTFHLRPGVKWSNGDPVTAHDFEYSWKRTLNPKLDPLAPYAYQLYYIKGAQAYNEDAKGTVDPSTVGVKAIDDQTLKVDLVNPTPYFLSLTSFYTYYPVNKKVAESNPKWSAEAETFVSNGPFKLSSWKHNDTLELVPFEEYYDKDSIKLKRVQFFMVKDANTELSMYRTDKLDWAGMPTGLIPLEQLEQLRQKKDPELVSANTASVYYYLFNNTKKPFSNVKVRKALAMAINRQQIVDKVAKGGQTPAYGFVPPGIHGVNGDYRSEVPDTYFKEDVEEAKKLLAEGLQEEGMSSFPDVTLAFNEGLHKDIAEAVADMWKTNLGITVSTETQEWKVFLQNRTSKNYDIARAGWGADYNDPMTFLDLNTSTSGNNDSGYNNSKYDSLIKAAYETNDQQKRVDLMKQAEQLFIGDDMSVMPIYYYTTNSLVKPYVKNYIIDYKGDIDYTRAFIQK